MQLMVSLLFLSQLAKASPPSPSLIKACERIETRAMMSSRVSSKDRSRLAACAAFGVVLTTRPLPATPYQNVRVNSPYGLRKHPIKGIPRHHNGVDLALARGTVVKPLAAGTVTMAKSHGGFGQVVVLKHSSGMSTVYAHLDRIDVERGQRVTEDDTLGTVGSTGLSTGPHLHLEVRSTGLSSPPLDPAPFLRRPYLLD